MARSPLTIDAALALLDGYEEEEGEARVAVREVASIDADDGLSLVPTTPATSDRFKRARERKKRELALLRSQTQALEETLHRIKQQRLTVVANDQLVWRLAATRQLHERQEAEQLNAQLRVMVDATLKQTLRLRAMLAYPEGFNTLVHHKRLHRHPEKTAAIASLVEFHGLLITLDLLELEVDDTLARSHGKPTTPMDRSEQGCRLLFEAFDETIVPYHVTAASQTAWRRLAFDQYPEEARADLPSTVYRTFGMDTVNCSFQLSYTGSIVYRRRILSDSRVVISWASEWEPVGLHDWCDIAHESVRRQGFVCLSPCPIDPSRFSSVQTFHRVERDACGELECDRGVLGDDTVAKAKRAVSECIADEIKRTIQGIESDLIAQCSWGSSTVGTAMGIVTRPAGTNGTENIAQRQPLS
jgi:hypothetical protein